MLAPHFIAGQFQNVRHVSALFSKKAPRKAAKAGRRTGLCRLVRDTVGIADKSRAALCEWDAAVAIPRMCQTTGNTTQSSLKRGPALCQTGCQPANEGSQVTVNGQWPYLPVKGTTDLRRRCDRLQALSHYSKSVWSIGLTLDNELSVANSKGGGSTWAAKRSDVSQPWISARLHASCPNSCSAWTPATSISGVLLDVLEMTSCCRGSRE